MPRSFKLFLLVVFFQYATQNLFFVATAAFLANSDNAMMSMGNLLLIAMIPFFLSGFFLGPRFDRFSVRQQLSFIKILRLVSFSFVAIGLFLKLSPSFLLYSNVFAADLGFFLFLSTASRVSKDFSVSSAKKTESAIVLLTQLGMVAGALLSSFALTNLSLKGIFLIAAVFELSSLLVSQWIRVDAKTVVDILQPRKDFLEAFKAVSRTPKAMAYLFPFILVLPMLQVFNLFVAPWTESTFHDSGQVLAYISAGCAAGACCGSLLLIKWTRLRESQWLPISPFLIAIAVAGLFFSQNTSVIIAFSMLLGIGFSGSRIAANSALIEVTPKNRMNEVSIIGLMMSILCSAFLVLALRHIPVTKVSLSFSVLALIAISQMIVLISNRKKLCHID
ncbi:MFS transporter [bacterium]|nr:MFS transporter [bacterium]